MKNFNKKMKTHGIINLKYNDIFYFSITCKELFFKSAINVFLTTYHNHIIKSCSGYYKFLYLLFPFSTTSDPALIPELKWTICIDLDTCKIVFNSYSENITQKWYTLTIDINNIEKYNYFNFCSKIFNLNNV